MLKHTALYAEHQKLGARLVDFAGWEMPIQYQSQLEEHHAVRQNAGMFDVAHMCAVDVSGADASAFLQYLLANDVAKLKTIGKALYSCMLREDAGVIDDLIVYRTGEASYRVVVNAGTTDKDLAWMRQQAAGYSVCIDQRADLSIIAVQGPEARAKVHALLTPTLAAACQQLTPFSAAWEGDYFIGRTGYTGEDGFEVIVPHRLAVSVWESLLASGVKPCGLGARDTLRLEAGMNLYGQDMDESVHPLAAGLAWTLALNDERSFIGRSALQAHRANGHQQFIGLVLTGRGVLRAHMPVRFANGVRGETTSGGFAPTLKQSIALARIGTGAAGDCAVEIRGAWVAARVVKPPFVRAGTVLV
jgi:aminomethyltransferase